MTDAPSAAPFPSQTAWSTILAVRDRNDPEWRNRLDRLVRTYWPPVWWYLQRFWNCSREDAADLAQEFFTRLCEEDFLKHASPERGRFRMFLKMKLKNTVVDELRRRLAQKRGGDARRIPISGEPGEGISELRWPGLSPEEEFDRVWATSLISTALEELRQKMESEGRGPMFQAFHRCAVETPPLSARDCAARLGLKEMDVRNYVARTRKELQKVLHRHVRDSVEHDGDADDELSCVLRFLGS